MEAAIWPDPRTPDDAPDAGRCFTTYAAKGGALPRPAYDHHFRAALAGDVDAARQIGVGDDWTWDALEPWIAPDVPSVDVAARIAADIAPDMGGVGADRLLRPVWLDLDPQDPEHRRALLVALAVVCFVPAEDDHHLRAPFTQWTRRSPEPPLRERATLRAVERAPHRLLRVVSCESTWKLRDLALGEDLDATPSELAAVTGTPDAPTLAVARVVPSFQGPLLTFGWTFDGDVDEDVARAALLGVRHRLRLLGGAPTKEDVLRSPAWVRTAVALAAFSGRR
jgi:hypothetical protein